jgi:Protein of unknown function DUF262/CAP12/Pycsar effector protein, TIR domain
MRFSGQGYGVFAMPESRLEIQSLKVRDVVEDYRSGRLVVPEFQREYVWKPSRAPRLIDSIYRGFPISVLLLWTSDVETRSRRKEPRPSRSALISWLIDGQQRVITLSRIFSGDEGIHDDAERTIVDKEGGEHVLINPNVLIEIGAAMAFYGRRFILLVRDGVKLPSNLQGLYEVRYNGENLEAGSTIKLLEAIKDIKNYALPSALNAADTNEVA